MLYLGLTVFSALLISSVESLPILTTLFETASAIATVGLSTGITPLLNELSQMILIVLMYFGRVGVMTVSLGFLLRNSAEERYRFADTKVMIG